MRKGLAAWILGMSIVAAACGGGGSDPPNPPQAPSVSFTTIDQGGFSGYTRVAGQPVGNGILLSFHSSGDFQSFWALHNAGGFPLPPLPIVDFTAETVLAVIAPVQTSGGYSLTIDSLSEVNQTMVVAARLTKPGANCATAAVLTQPFQIVQTAATNDILSLSLSSETVDCR